METTTCCSFQKTLFRRWLFEGTVIGPLVAPNSVGRMLRVGNPEGLLLGLDKGQEVGFAESTRVRIELASTVGLELPIVVVVAAVFNCRG
jgi:hypothetical protein